jgi:hypothetical protein
MNLILDSWRWASVRLLTVASNSPTSGNAYVEVCHSKKITSTTLTTDLGVHLAADGEGGIAEASGVVHHLQPGRSSLVPTKYLIRPVNH